MGAPARPCNAYGGGIGGNLEKVGATGFFNDVSWVGICRVGGDVRHTRKVGRGGGGMVQANNFCKNTMFGFVGRFPLLSHGLTEEINRGQNTI